MLQYLTQSSQQAYEVGQGGAAGDCHLFLHEATGTERGPVCGHRAGKWCGSPWSCLQHVSYSLVFYYFLSSGGRTGSVVPVSWGAVLLR